MFNTKNAKSWQETGTKIRLSNLLSGRSSPSIEDAGSEDEPDLFHLPQWSNKEIESFIRATKLCNECSGVFLNESTPKKARIDGYYFHHDSYDSLLRCADSGCRVCVGLVRKAQMWLSAETTGSQRNNHLCILWKRKPLLRALTRFSRQYEFLIGEDSTGAVESELQSLWTLDKEDCGNELLLELLKNSPMTNLCIIVYGLNHFINPAPNSSSLDLLSVARWVRDCTGYPHKECQKYRRRSTQSLRRPKRLLKICDYQTDMIQLVDSDCVQNKGYATLSHRWGNPEPPKLSAIRDESNGKVSMTDLKSGVPLSTLPRTFRDAFKILSHCRLQYLWIDSLCIIQDQNIDGNNPDWEREAAKVGDIYAGAVFNIAALSGLNSDDGLFPRQEELLISVIRQNTVRQESRIPPHLRQDVKITSTLLCDSDLIGFKGAILDSELLSRGWVYQEILLSPANLFCTAEQMWWSCSHASFSQIFPKGHPGNIGGTKMVKDELRAKKEAIMVPDDCADPVRAWMEAITHYTRTSVTFRNDRLPAISGIAHTFRALFPTIFQDASYHSGVWSTELVRQLSWHRVPTDDIPVSGFVTDHYMPSWSPASFNGPIFHYGTHTKDMLPIELIKLDTSEVDIFGCAKEARHSVLHVRGVPVEMNLTYGLEDLNAWPTGYPEIKVDVCWDNLAEMNSAGEPTASYQALALFEFPTGLLQGLLLRKLCSSRDSGDEVCDKWVRCAWFLLDYRRSGLPTRRVDEAFQFRRYGYSRLERGSDQPIQNCDSSGWPTDLEDILIV